MKHAEILKTEFGYTVIIDGMFADELGVDETLGCIASALFNKKDRPIYVRTYLEWVEFEKTFLKRGFMKPVALLPYKGVSA